MALVPDDVVDADGRLVAFKEQEMARLEAEGLDYLQTIELELDGILVESVVRFGDPVRRILTEAAAFEADLIAIRTRPRSALGRAVLGSVAERVFRTAAIPVMLFRS